MDIVVGGRASGKTHYLIEQTVEAGDGAILLVATVEARLRAIEQMVPLIMTKKGVSKEEARRSAIFRVRIPSWGPVGTQGPIFIDDLNYILAQLLGRYPGDIRAVADTAPVRTPQGRHLGVAVANPDV